MQGLLKPGEWQEAETLPVPCQVPRKRGYNRLVKAGRAWRRQDGREHVHKPLNEPTYLENSTVSCVRKPGKQAPIRQESVKLLYPTGSRSGHHLIEPSR